MQWSDEVQWVITVLRNDDWIIQSYWTMFWNSLPHFSQPKKYQSLQSSNLIFARSFRFQRGKTRKMMKDIEGKLTTWIVTQLDDLSPLYWDLSFDHLSPTSREHRNRGAVMYQLASDLWEHDVKRSLCVDYFDREIKFVFRQVFCLTLQVEVFEAD